MYQRILVPVDGSATALQGLQQAIALARLSGGQLRLLHVTDELSAALALGSYAPVATDIFAVLHEAGQELLNQARAQAIDQGIAADVVLDEAPGRRLADAVLEQVRSWPADLIVLGTHGRRGVSHLLLGSDAEQVLRVAPVPVLLVRSADEPAPQA